MPTAELFAMLYLIYSGVLVVWNIADTPIEVNVNSRFYVVFGMAMWLTFIVLSLVILI